MKFGGGLLALLLVLIVAGVCVRLGFWQLDRLEQRRQYNRAVSEAMQDPPILLDAAGLDSISRNPSGFLYRRAVATGLFEPGSEVLLRGRAEGGRPGVHLISLLRLDGTGEPILVNRGWIPSADAATADPRPFRQGGPRTVEGILHAMPPPDSDAAGLPIQLSDTTISSYRRLTSEAFPPSVARELPALYLQQVTGSGAGAELPVPVPVPELTEGSHLGYAIQWFSFAAIAVVGFLITVRLRLRKAARNPEQGV